MNMLFFLFTFFCFISTLDWETCKEDPLKDSPFCDTSLYAKARVADLLKRFTMAEKIAMTVHTAAGCDRLKVNKYQWAPNVNIFRDPRWGRGQETVGEDPYHSSMYSKTFIEGMQEGEDPRFLKSLPCCKHYSAYDLENWHGVDRFHFDAVVSDRDMEETFQPPFQACVEEGHAHQIMCSYNSINSIPGCAHDFLMNKIMRDEWKFDGHIVSDCGAVGTILNAHKYTKTEEETCQVALRSGCDLNCGEFYHQHLGKTIDKKMLNETDIDLALGRLFENRIRLGEFDPWEDQPYRKIPKDHINTKEHQELALEAALQSMTLLKNDDGVLPLAKDVASIAVIGPNAKATKTLQGNYYGPAPYLVSVFDGISKYTTPTYAHGCDIDSQDKSHFKEAKDIAAAADITVLVMGIDQSIESEGKDREKISFPGVQSDLISEVKASAKGKVILVTINGGMVDIADAEKNCDAILIGGYPGQSGGDAVASVLFGDYNPAGRLATTLYPSSYTDACDYFEMTMRPSKKCANGRSYKFFNGSAVYEFGDGLSYTTFKYEWTDGLERVSFGDNEDPKFRVKVTNTGKVDGDDVVLAFVSNDVMGDAPLRELFGFDRIHLKVGESKDVYFGMKKSQIEYVTRNGERKVVPGEYTLTINKEAERKIFVK